MGVGSIVILVPSSPYSAQDFLWAGQITKRYPSSICTVHSICKTSEHSLCHLQLSWHLCTPWGACNTGTVCTSLPLLEKVPAVQSQIIQINHHKTTHLHTQRVKHIAQRKNNTHVGTLFLKIIVTCTIWTSNTNVMCDYFCLGLNYVITQWYTLVLTTLQ